MIKINEQLREALEKIIFNEELLDTLKNAIDGASADKLSSKQLKLLIIQQRTKIFKDLLEFFPYQVENYLDLNSLEELTSNQGDPELNRELEIKNQFLEEVGMRISRIHEKLKDNLKI